MLLHEKGHAVPAVKSASTSASRAGLGWEKHECHHISTRQSMALQLKQMGNRDLAMGLIAYQLEQAQKAKPNEMIETWTVDMGTY